MATPTRAMDIDMFSDVSSSPNDPSGPTRDMNRNLEEPFGTSPPSSQAVYRLKDPEALFRGENDPVQAGQNVSSGIAMRLKNGTRTAISARKPSANKELPHPQLESPDDLVLRLSNEFEQIVDPNWDTVIYIGYPPQEHLQDDHEYEYIKQRFSKPYLMNSQTLRDLKSTRFDKFLGPMSARAERKLRKIGVHHLVPQDRKPKYYIDLRPMQDEDEALLMMTELTCAPELLSWHHSHLASGVPRTLVCGKDTLNVTSKPYHRPWIEVNDDVVITDGNDSEVEENVQEKARPDDVHANILDLEPDYSAIRHYMAIQRVLHAMTGTNPKLNSAPKVWTYFSIAKFLDCAHNERISTWIYDWLFSTNNSNFIQGNPEIAYRMASGIKSTNILRATFAILVAERALIQAGRNSSESGVMQPGNSKATLHNRNFGHLDDDEINRIDHAAHSLTRRVTAIFDSLANGPLNWTGGTTELAKFDILWEHAKTKSFVDQPHSLLHSYVRGEIYQALSQNVAEGDLVRLYRSKGFREFGWLKRSQAFADAYNGMTLPQRLLTQSFWAQLENYGLYQEAEKTVAWSHGHTLDGLEELAPDFEKEIICIHRSQLRHSIALLNDQVKVDNRWYRLAIEAWDENLFTNPHNNNIPYKFLIGDGPQPNHEIVRAIQGLGSTAEDITGDIPRGRVYNEGHFDEHYPYTDVVHTYRNKDDRLKVKTALLLAELSMAMRARIIREVLTPGYMTEEDMGMESEIRISQMDILLSLNDDEWKYLPLWAGGLDDGSGGVFNELDVPDMLAVEGFRGGKMGLNDVAVGEGSVGGSFSMAGDSEDFDEVMTDEGVSTVGKASRIATDGTTAAGAHSVMSLDE